MFLLLYYTVYYTDTFCLSQIIKTLFIYNFYMIQIFAKNLKELRLQKNLTQKELAKELGTTQRRVSYLEMGRSEPDVQTLCLIADFFDVTTDELLGRDNL